MHVRAVSPLFEAVSLKCISISLDKDSQWWSMGKTVFSNLSWGMILLRVSRDFPIRDVCGFSSILWSLGPPGVCSTESFLALQQAA